MKRPDLPGAPGTPRSVRGPSRVQSVAESASRFAPRNSDERRFTSGRRRRRRAWLTGGGVLVAVALVVTGIVMSPLLTLTDIVVKGRDAVAERIIVGAASDQVGQPLVALNYDAIHERLSSVTRIQSFTTEIQPPHTLVIRVVERQAIGFMVTESQWEVVDAAGVVIDTVSEEPSGIPELLGESTTDIAFSAMAETLVSLPNGVRAIVASISAQTRDSVRFTLRGVGHEIVWGSPDNSAVKIVVMDRALRVADRSDGVFEIDVSAPDNIVLRPLREITTRRQR